VDLCSVAKELVENSLDAGATSIGAYTSAETKQRMRFSHFTQDVRFKNQGLDSIEVQDNGYGISPQNYESLALKHYTSKLSTYADLNTLQTFGFRGEALSSLCALSQFTVVTCLQSDVPRGTRLEFGTSGKLEGTSVVAAQKGTTVFVENLFKNLPVRRRELERNIKREWGKVVTLLNQYACVQTGVKFTVSQQPTKGKRIAMFATRGNTATRDNIINVFGAKTMTALIPLDLTLQLEPTSKGPNQKWALLDDEDVAAAAAAATMVDIHVRGHVSRPAHGEGRQTPDRQMFYVNGRPCQLPQFAKVFNEVYKSYNTSQSPFIFADIQLDTHLYDVNVSPDKRTILLHDQGRMLDTLRESLIELFEKQDITVPISNIPAQRATPFKKLTVNRKGTPASNRARGEGAEASQDSNEEGAAEIPAVESGEESESENGSHSRKPQTRISTSKKKSISKASPAENLITRWVERKAVDRPGADGKVHHSPSRDDSTDQSRSKSISTEKRDYLMEKSQESGSADGSERDEDGESRPAPRRASISDEIDSGSEPPRRQGKRGQELPPSGQARPPRDFDDSTSPGLTEPKIPSIAPPARISGALVGGVPSSRLPKRPFQETAIITIGDETVTSTIGTPSKRQKLRKDAGQDSRTLMKTSAPLPSFGGRLTQMFGAQSKSAHSSDDEVELGTETVDDIEDATSAVEGGDSDEDEEEEAEDEEIEEEEGEEEEEQEDEDDGTTAKPSLPALERTGSPFLASGDEQDIEQSQESDSRALVHEDSVVEDDDDDDDDDADDDDEDVGDGDYDSEGEKPAEKERPEAKMGGIGRDATERRSEEIEKRSQTFVKGWGRKRDSTLHYVQNLRVDDASIGTQFQSLADRFGAFSSRSTRQPAANGLDADDAEEKLSLIISKSDFAKMRIVGQFNLGFVLAVRESEGDKADADADADGSDGGNHIGDDDLFIIDQHASDEKYNFERLQASTIVQSQRLVRPKPLELTAVEEEIIIENQEALEANGFSVSVDNSGAEPVGSRCRLLSLPLSRETTFTLADLEELIALLGDRSSATTIPRPSRVRKMFAMRACRSSIMIGKALSQRQMEKVVRHMGEMEKPWNCPHGRPTMRHLSGLSAFDGRGWSEDDGFDGSDSPVDWMRFAKGKKRVVA